MKYTQKRELNFNDFNNFLLISKYVNLCVNIKAKANKYNDQILINKNYDFDKIFKEPMKYNLNVILFLESKGYCKLSQ